MTRVATMIAVSMAAFCLGACGSSQSLRLRVTDDAGQPVRTARVRTTSLNTSDIPLPLTWNRIEEMLTKTTLHATTNNKGEVRLSVLPGYAQYVQVLPPLTDDALLDRAETDGLEWHWYLDPDPLTVEAPADRPNPAGLNLAVVP